MEAEEDDDPDGITDIFKIKGNLFDFETLLCKAFNDFNYLLKIDKDLFTFDIQGIGTYEEYELINPVTRDLEEPWSDNRVPYQLSTWDGLGWNFQDHKWYDELADGKLKEEALLHKEKVEESWGDATPSVIKFYAWSINSFGNFHELDYNVLRPYANIKTEKAHDLYLEVNNIFGRNYDTSNAQDNQGHEERRDDPTLEPSVCKIRRFEMMKYSFNADEEYIAIKESEYLNHSSYGSSGYFYFFGVSVENCGKLFSGELSFIGSILLKVFVAQEVVGAHGWQLLHLPGDIELDSQFNNQKAVIRGSSPPPVFCSKLLDSTVCSEAYLRWRSAPLSTMYPPMTSESSVGDYSSESSVGPSRKRCRDFISSEDSVEEDIDTGGVRGTLRLVDVEVDIEDEVKDEVESSERGTMEVGVDMVSGIDIPDAMLMPDAVEHLEQRELESRSLIAGGERASLLEQVASLKRSNARLFAEADPWFCYDDRMRFRRLGEGPLLLEAFRFSSMISEAVMENGVRWNGGNGKSKMRIIGMVGLCSERTDVAFAMSWRELMKLMAEVYCPRNEIQKMEFELRLEVIKETPHGQPTTFKRPNVGGQNVARAYTAGNNERKSYNGPFPHSNKCKLHHEGPCTVRCGKCKKCGRPMDNYKRDCQDERSNPMESKVEKEQDWGKQRGKIKHVLAWRRRSIRPLIFLGEREIASVALKQVSGSGFRVRTGFRRGWVKGLVATCDGGGFKEVGGNGWGREPGIGCPIRFGWVLCVQWLRLACSRARIGPSKSSQSLSNAHKWAVVID
ncbi:hypothetical protein Tco_1385763 [Tanacetum coccineum]